MQSLETKAAPAATFSNRPSLLAYAGLWLFCLLTSLVGPYLAERGATNLRLFGWDGLGLVALGGLGVWLAPRVGFTDGLDTRVTAWQRLGRPVLYGLAFAVADVALFKLVLHPEPVTELTPFMQPFPYSVLLYGSGALYTETLHRFLPLPVLMLVGSWWLPKAYHERLFWVLAVLSSLVEPWQQRIDDTPVLLAYSLGTGFAMNFLQAAYFRRYGFLAALMVRLGHYVLWHVGFGLWVESL